MGGIHLAVEVAARDVAQLIHMHKVLPQVQHEVNRRMQDLVRLSMSVQQLRDAAPRVPSDEIAAWVMSELIEKVIESEVPKVQVVETEKRAAQLQSEISVLRETIAQREREIEDLHVRLRQHDAAREYMMQSYFREVGALRQHIVSLSHSMKGKESVSCRTEGSAACGSPLSHTASTLTPTNTCRSFGRLKGGAAEDRTHSPLTPPVDALSAPWDHRGNDDASERQQLKPLPGPLVSFAEQSSHTSMSFATPRSFRVPQSAEAALEQRPSAEVDALFDYEKYVSITNETIISWPQRYEALQRKCADTIQQLQITSASNLLQCEKKVLLMQTELKNRDTALATLTAFVRQFHPIVMRCVKDGKQRLVDDTAQLRRDVVQLQRGLLEWSIALSDKIQDVEKRLTVFVLFVKHCAARLHQKLRQVQDGQKVRANHGRPLWQFFLVSPHSDGYAEAKRFWQDQPVTQDILEEFKQLLLAAERISSNVFGPPSDDEADLHAEPPIPVGQVKAEPLPETLESSKRGRGGTARGRGGRGGRGAAATPLPSKGKGSKAASQRAVSPQQPPPLPLYDREDSELANTSSSRISHPQPTSGAVSPVQSALVSGKTSPFESPPSAAAPSLTGFPRLREESVASVNPRNSATPSTKEAPLKKSEEFIRNLVKRTVDAKLRRVMCKIRRRVFIQSLPLKVQNILAHILHMDEDIRRADAAVVRYEQRRQASEVKRKELMSATLAGGSLFSALFRQVDVIAAAKRMSTASGGSQPPVDALKREGSGTIGGAEWNKMASKRTSVSSSSDRSMRAQVDVEQPTPPPTADAAARAVQRDAADAMVELQAYSAFHATPAAAGRTPTVSLFSPSSQIGSHGPTPTTDRRQSLTPGAPSWERRWSGTSGASSGFDDAARLTSEEALLTPATTIPTSSKNEPLEKMTTSARRGRTSLHIEEPCSAAAPRSVLDTPMPLALVPAPSPFPPQRFALAPPQPVASFHLPQHVDYDDDDGTAFRIQSLEPRQGHFTTTSSRPGSTFAVPTLPSATTRTIAARSRQMYTHELELRAGSRCIVSAVMPPPSRPPTVDSALPSLRHSTVTPAPGLASGLAVTPRTPSSSSRPSRVQR